MAPILSWNLLSFAAAGLCGLLLVVPAGLAEAKPEPADADYIKVEVRGKLRHGLVAIGGETTGTTISARGVTWELDLKGNPKLLKLAEQLDGQMALVAGTLEVRAGVEIPQRWIVTVERLAPANAKGGP